MKRRKKEHTHVQGWKERLKISISKQFRRRSEKRERSEFKLQKLCMWLVSNPLLLSKASQVFASVSSTDRFPLILTPHSFPFHSFLNVKTWFQLSWRKESDTRLVICMSPEKTRVTHILNMDLWWQGMNWTSVPSSPHFTLFSHTWRGSRKKDSLWHTTHIKRDKESGVLNSNLNWKLLLLLLLLPLSCPKIAWWCCRSSS